MRYSLSLSRSLDVVEVRLTAWPMGARYPDRLQVLQEDLYRPVGTTGLVAVSSVLETVIQRLQAQQGYTDYRSGVSPYEI